MPINRTSRREDRLVSRRRWPRQHGQPGLNPASFYPTVNDFQIFIGSSFAPESCRQTSGNTSWTNRRGKRAPSRPDDSRKTRLEERPDQSSYSTGERRTRKACYWFTGWGLRPAVERPWG